MDYRIIIFAVKDKIGAIDVSRGDFTFLSFDGNTEAPFESREDVTDFCETFFDEYNINAFGEIPLDFTVINFESDADLVFALADRLKNGSRVNVVNAERLIPQAVMNAGFDGKRRVVAEFRGCKYSAECDKRGEIAAAQCEDKKSDITLTHKDFAFVYHPMFIKKNDDELMQKAAERESALKAEFEGEKKKLRSEFAGLKSELEATKRQLDSYISAEQKKLEDEKIKNDSKRKLIVANISYDDCDGELLPIINWNSSYPEGCIVKANTTIGAIYRVVWSDLFIVSSGYVHTKQILEVKTKITGRIFYLKKEYPEKPDGYDLIRGFRKNTGTVLPGDHLAIIGSVDDTRESVLKWYKQAYGNDSKFVGGGK